MSSNEWKTVTLGEISKDISYGYTASAQWEPVGPKFLRITDIVSGLNWDTVPYCEIDEAGYKKYRLEIGDIVIARTGATTGTAEIVKEDKQAVFASYLIRFRIDETIAAPFFIGHVLKSNSWKEFIKSSLSGSAQPGANATVLSRYEISLPPLEIQHRIASILSALDDKIELNRQTNATLEAIAQSIFREWFVEFNFPGATGEMMESELGAIPNKWVVGTLGDIVEVKGGTTPSTKEEKYWNGEYHFATPKDLSNLTSPVLLDTERKITKEGVSQISSGILPEGTLLLSSRAPIGYLAISNIPVSINQGFIAINAKVTSNLFVLYWLKENMDTIVSRANGSTFLEISKTSFKEIKLAIPDSETPKRFEEVASPIFEQIKSNELESSVLASIRDILLPRLMRGEIEA
jgi:type I restriction enzyme, S subunit